MNVSLRGVALSLVFGLASVPAVAAPPDAASEGPADPGELAIDPADQQLQKAEQIYLDARSLYDLADYEGAIERWTEAYALIPNDEAGRAAKVSLTYNIARAHIDAYEVNGELAHLIRARTLLDRFLRDAQALAIERKDPEISRDVANATYRIEWIDRKVAEAKQAADTRRELSKLVARNTLAVEESRSTRAMYGTGIGLTAVGGGALVMMVTGLAVGSHYEEQSGIPELAEGERIVAIDRGERANKVAIAGGVIAGVLLPTGITLWVISRVRAKRERARVIQELEPLLGRGTFGLAWGGRF